MLVPSSQATEAPDHSTRTLSGRRLAFVTVAHSHRRPQPHSAVRCGSVLSETSSFCSKRPDRRAPRGSGVPPSSSSPECGFSRRKSRRSSLVLLERSSQASRSRSPVCFSSSPRTGATSATFEPSAREAAEGTAQLRPMRAELDPIPRRLARHKVQRSGVRSDWNAATRPSPGPWLIRPIRGLELLGICKELGEIVHRWPARTGVRLCAGAFGLTPMIRAAENGLSLYG